PDSLRAHGSLEGPDSSGRLRDWVGCLRLRSEMGYSCLWPGINRSPPPGVAVALCCTFLVPRSLDALKAPISFPTAVAPRLGLVRSAAGAAAAARRPPARPRAERGRCGQHVPAWGGSAGAAAADHGT